LTLHISLPRTYDTGQKQAAFFDELARRVQSVPGVRAAAASWVLPMMGFPKTPVQLAGQPLQPLNQRPLAAIQDVTTGFFRAFEVPLKRGRNFSEADTASAPFTTIVNEAFARLFWPAYPDGPDPLGQRVLIGARKDSFEIVGIVGDMHQALAVDPFPTVFRVLDQHPISGAAFTVRTSGDPLKFVTAVRDQVRTIDRDQPVSSVQTMEDLIAAEGGQRRVVLTLLECFGGAALLLSIIGIYGLIAYSVAQRTQEVGIRRALGARDLDILRLVVGNGLALTLAGIALGMCGAFGLTRILTSLLYRTSATDPATFALAALLFLLVAAGATYFPARRATKLDPSRALK
jgi:putative ABC transport system permease protein